METHILFFVAAVAAGAINTLAGGGGLLTFPLLTLVLSPVTADATSSVALLPAYPTAVWSTRRELAGAHRRWLGFLLATSVVGGLAGTLMLVRTDDRNFVFLVPWVVLGGTALFVLEPIQVPTNRSKRRTLRQDSGTRAPTGTANTVPSNKNKVLPLSASGHRIAAVIRESRVKPTHFEQPADTRVLPYSPTKKQNQSSPHTVLSRKNIPYRPTNACSLPKFPDFTTKGFSTKYLQITGFYIVWSPIRIYRTLRQALPYSPARDTVPSDKHYRTLRQVLAYSPTSITVLRRKT